MTEEITPLSGDPVLLNPDADRLGVRTLFVDVLLRPAAAMRRLAAHAEGKRRWFAPLLILALVTVATIAASQPSTQRYTRAVAMHQVQTMQSNDPSLGGGQSSTQMVDAMTSGPLATVQLGFGIVFGILGVFLAALISAAILHFLGTVMGGQQSFSQILTTTAWAHVPAILGGLVRFAGALAGNFDPSPAGLSGLVAADPFETGAKASLLAPLLGQIELWNLWTLGLMAVAVYTVCKLSRGKAVLTVVILVVLGILAGMAGVAAANAISGLAGS